MDDICIPRHACTYKNAIFFFKKKRGIKKILTNYWIGLISCKIKSNWFTKWMWFTKSIYPYSRTWTKEEFSDKERYEAMEQPSPRTWGCFVIGDFSPNYRLQLSGMGWGFLPWAWAELEDLWGPSHVEAETHPYNIWFPSLTEEERGEAGQRWSKRRCDGKRKKIATLDLDEQRKNK